MVNITGMKQSLLRRLLKRADYATLDLKPEAAGFSAVIYGHSHVPNQEMKNGVLYFNPGSAGPKRFKLPITIGKLFLENSKLRGEIVRILKS